MKIAKVIATFFGIGYCPIASGTAGSLAAVVLCYFLDLSSAVNVSIFFAVLLIGIWASGVVEKESGETDPSCVVIDEVAGMMIACFLLPKTILFYAAAFFLFRFFDITKIYPIKSFEKLPGGWGVMMDDVVAGLMTNFVLMFTINVFF